MGIIFQIFTSLLLFAFFAFCLHDDGESGWLWKAALGVAIMIGIGASITGLFVGIDSGMTVQKDFMTLYSMIFFVVAMFGVSGLIPDTVDSVFIVVFLINFVIGVISLVLTIVALWIFSFTRHDWLIVGSIVGVSFAVVGILVIWVLIEESRAERREQKERFINENSLKQEEL